MDVIDDDYLKYVLHVEAVAAPSRELDLDRAVYEAAEDPVAGTAALAARLLSEQGIDVATMQTAEARAVAQVLARGG
jgi:hypothetical protein